MKEEKRKTLLDAIGELPEEMIEEAGDENLRKYKRKNTFIKCIRYGGGGLAVAAVLCILFQTGVFSIRMGSDAPKTSFNATKQLTDSDDSILKEFAESSSDESGNACLYEELEIPSKTVPEEILYMEKTQNNTGDSEANPFSESRINKDCEGVVEGKLLKMKSVTYRQEKRVVYTLEVIKVWSGFTDQEVKKGSIIKLEDEHYVADAVLGIGQGGTYVFPVTSAPDKGNKITADYSLYYPEYPQIEKTEDGNYIVPEDWTSICEEGVNILISPEDTSGEQNFEAYYDRMVLVSGEIFERKMKALLK